MGLQFLFFKHFFSKIPISHHHYSLNEKIFAPKILEAHYLRIMDNPVNHQTWGQLRGAPGSGPGSRPCIRAAFGSH